MTPNWSELLIHCRAGLSFRGNLTAKEMGWKNHHEGKHVMKRLHASVGITTIEKNAADKLNMRQHCTLTANIYWATVAKADGMESFYLRTKLFVLKCYVGHCRESAVNFKQIQSVLFSGVQIASLKTSMAFNFRSCTNDCIMAAAVRLQGQQWKAEGF